MLKPDTTAIDDTADVVSRTQAVRALVRIARMLEHVSTEVTLPQYRLLSMVACGDCRASKLAGRLALSKPTVTAVVDGLVERGMLSRSEVVGDRRAVQLSLTDAGRVALLATDRAMGERLAQVLARCDDPALVLAGLRQLGVGLERVLIEQMSAAAPPSGPISAGGMPVAATPATGRVVAGQADESTPPRAGPVRGAPPAVRGG
jgi:DNA-binding MarR family transcriptional regulator